MAAFAEFLPVDGIPVVIEDKVLDVAGTEILDINDFLLKDDATTVQIFFSEGIPADPVISANAGDLFSSYNRRVFMAYNERAFQS